MTIPVLIPAFNPNPAFVSLVGALIEAGMAEIIIVNDGSGPSYRPVFETLAGTKGCRVLHHAVNLGKGRAIKTGLNYFYAHSSAPGIITADCDGQHAAADIRKMADAMEQNPGMLVLGVRTFNNTVPFKSRLGNEVTRVLYYVLTGNRLSDTQTGLRGIPRPCVPALLRLDGERYDFEMNMLVSLKSLGLRVHEQPIETIYIDENRESHFNPLTDSMLVYFLLIRFALSSAFASIIDFMTFYVAYAFLHKNLFYCIVMGRAVSSVVNFTINRSIVFRHHKNLVGTITAYYLLAAVLIILTKFFVDALMAGGVPVYAAKIIAEATLFIASFSMQRDYIFHAYPEHHDA